MSRNQVSVGALVNPFEGLQNTVGSIADRYFKQAELEEKRRREDTKEAQQESNRLENDRRWEISNSRQQEAQDQRRVEVQDKQDKKDFLIGFDPTQYKDNARREGIAATEFADRTGEVLKGLGKVTIGPNGERKPATQADIDNPNISTFPDFTEAMGDNLESRFDNLAPTEERTKDVVYRDVLAKTGDPTLAKNLATQTSTDLLSRKETMAEEKLRVAEFNKNRAAISKQVMDIQRYSKDASKTSTGKASKGLKPGWLDSATARTSIEALDIGSGDTADVMEQWKRAVGFGKDRAITLAVLRDNLIKGGKFTDDNIKITDAELFRQVDLLTGSLDKGSTSKVSANGLNLLNSSPVQSRTYEEIQKSKGAQAWGEGRNVSTPNKGEIATSSNNSYESYSGTPNEEQLKFTDPSTAITINEAKSEDLFNALIMQESGGNPDAVSRVGAFGLTQVMPATASNPGFGIAPMRNKSVEEQLRFGKEYLQAMQNKFGNNVDSLMAYNWGPGAVDKWIANGRNPTLFNKRTNPTGIPKETFDYVRKITEGLGKKNITVQYNFNASGVSIPKGATDRDVIIPGIGAVPIPGRGVLDTSSIPRPISVAEQRRQEISQKYYDSGPGGLRGLLGLD